jgi:outer membrane protein OmpA-like peptidoglycan-associated protein
VVWLSPLLLAAVTIEHRPCPTFVPGRAVAVAARMSGSAELFDPRVVYRFGGESAWRVEPLEPAEDVLSAEIATPTTATVFEYFIDVFDQHGDGPFRQGSPESPLRRDSAALDASCEQLPGTEPPEAGILYIGKVDLGPGALLAYPQALMQDRVGGSARASVALGIAAGGQRFLVEVEAGWLGFPAGDGGGTAGGIGFAAVGAGVALPLTRGYDFFQIDARAGIGQTGPFWRFVYDVSVSANFRAGAMFVGPHFSYLQIVDDDGYSDGDANVLLGGLTAGWMSETPETGIMLPGEIDDLPSGTDRDGDRVPDRADRCPDIPEDADGDTDFDGCPEPFDTDGDGRQDAADRCPTEPEDFDRFDDDDGCPEPDNDQDRVLDANDLCPTEPGAPQNAGCPVVDRDKDGILDEMDQCPDVPGRRPSGCPSRVLVVKTEQQIEIKEQINFKTDTAKITGKMSFEILDQVGQVMKSNPDLRIRVEGHTDERAASDYNLRLSAMRAEAVREALIQRGIDESRLESIGYGESRPLATNKSLRGRAVNRRVEFVILAR